MHPIDIFLLVCLAIFTWHGYKDGLVLALLKILIMIVALFIAVLYVDELSEIIIDYIPFVSTDTTTPVAFILIFLSIIIVVGFFAKLAKIINSIPLFGSLNQLFGALVGLIKGVIILSLITFFINYFIFGSPYKKYLIESNLYQSLEEIAPSIYNGISGLLPIGRSFYDEFNIIVKEKIDDQIKNQE